MLIQFTVGNYRSFGEEATLNMVANKKIAGKPEHCVAIGDTDQSVLRTAVIYGANAAGKSNLVKAISLGKRLITESSDRIRPVEPFASDAFLNRPSTFEFRFMVGSRVFTYGFDMVSTRVVGEWLSMLDGESEPLIFERNEEGIAVIHEGTASLFPDDPFIGILTQLRGLPTKKDQLFLNRAFSVPEEVLGPTLRSIIHWFSRDLVVLPPGSKSTDLLEQLATDGKLRELCASFLSHVGTGISGLFFSEQKRPMQVWERTWLEQVSKYGRSAIPYPASEVDMDVRPAPGDPSSVIVRRLYADHPSPTGRFSLPLSAQSDGTQTMLHLLPTIAAMRDESRVLVLDELDRSLHPMLTWEFIRFFSESCEGARKQLIATTHEVHLLNQELLRRDEYWFVEKDESQQSHLYSLMDFAIRNDLKLQKGYLQGRFGAIPAIGGMKELENLLECTRIGEETNATEETPA